MRITITLLGFLAVFVAPVFAIPVIISLSVRWRAWEVLIMGIFIDILWVPASFGFGLPLATVLSLLVVWGFEPLRRELL